MESYWYNKTHMENADPPRKRKLLRSTLSTTGWSTLAALFVSQALPAVVGYPLSRFMGWLVGLFTQGAAFRSVMLNQWIVSGKQLTGGKLKRAARRVFAYQSAALYAFYRALRFPGIAGRMVRFSPAFSRLVEECKKEERGTLLLIPHLSGFNLGGLRLVQEGLRYLTLANTDHSRAYQWQNELRNRHGMQVLPFTIQALRQARERLQAGGTVLTGIDRPIEDSRYTPRFFGYPASLPVAYVRLALRTGARVFVVGFTTLKDRTHLIDVSEEVVMERHADAEQELVRNAEKVLAEAEKFIRRDPLHWMMFFPVWPGEMDGLEGQGQ
jgi:lauroyl/myristoyl acyltransferase